MLEEIAKRTFSLFPSYVRLLWTILTHPVSEVSLRALRGGFAKDACTLWAVSALIFFVIRLIAWNAEVNPTLFMVSRMLGEAVTLIGVTLGIYWGGCLVGGKAGPGAILTATAYVWGALMPVQAVANIVMFSVMEPVAPGTHALLVNMVNGCEGLGGLAKLQGLLQAGAGGESARYLAFYALLAALFVTVTGLELVYAVAWLRVLWRLHAVSRLRYGVAVLVGGALALLLATFGAVFSQLIWSPNAPCLPPIPG